MSVVDSCIRVNVVCKVSEKSVLLGEACDRSAQLTQSLFVLLNCHGALLGHVIQHLVLLVDAREFSLRLLQLLIHRGDATALVICTPLVQVENALFLAVLF